jgi:transposase
MHPPPLKTVFGTDIDSQKIVIARLKPASLHTIANTRPAILAWMRTLPQGCVIGMEATGRLHQALADLAVARGHTAHVINPKHIANYARGVGQRGKTDLLDAQVIARYVEREADRLRPYTPPTAWHREVQALLAQRAGVVKHRAAIKASLKDCAATQPTARSVNTAIKKSLEALKSLIQAIEARLLALLEADPALKAKSTLLQSIMGIGSINAVAITHRLSRTPYANSDAVVAAYGLDPRPKDSGNSVGRRRLTKQGHSEDRRLIYLAAQSAVKSKLFKPRYQELLGKGFERTEAIVIIARKLLRIAFAVWTSNQPFDPKKVGLGPCKKP